MWYRPNIDMRSILLRSVITILLHNMVMWYKIREFILPEDIARIYSMMFRMGRNISTIGIYLTVNTICAQAIYDCLTKLDNKKFFTVKWERS